MYQLNNRSLQERSCVVSEDQQCFGDFGRLCVGLMRSVWIMNKLADLPHDSVSSMKHEGSESAGFQSPSARLES